MSTFLSEDNLDVVSSARHSSDKYTSSDAEEEALTAKDDAIIAPNGQFTWPFRTLSTLIRMAKGKVSKSVLEFIKAHLKGTRLIFVVGQTGSGKTTLLGEITSQKLEIGHTATSGTLGYQVIPAIIHGQQYLFIDTPGFGAADLSDDDVYDDIMSCVGTLGQWVTIAGVMFVHKAQETRLTRAEMTTIRWLECFCGPQFFKNITIVMTQWDNITQNKMEQARENAKELERLAFDDILFPKHIKGGRVYNHGVNLGGGSKWDVLSCESRVEERRQLAANFRRWAKGWGLYETEAAKSLFRPLKSPTVCILRNKALLMNLDELVIPKANEDKRTAGVAPTAAPQQPTEESTWKWWEIAKEVAWTFWGFNKTGKTKYTEYQASVAADVWERLKNWWSGTAPPQ
ncbi:P-loop containing nucleoside triphosphate hydrolase protein [Aspergillus venezuelensis]